VDGPADGDFSLDGIEETDELLMAIAPHAAADQSGTERPP